MIKLRSAQRDDLTAINQVITAAIRQWQLPERVKRLALPSYHYNQADWQHLNLLVAEQAEVGIIALAAWEPADPAEAPANPALLLYGLYVQPEYQRQGLGQRLLQQVQQQATQAGYAGVLIKAQADAAAFFAAQGLTPLAISDPSRHYPYRYWWPAANSAAST